VLSLKLLGLKAGSTVRVRCIGKGCPIKTKTRRITKATARLTLTSLFKGKVLRPRMVLEVRISRPGYLARTVRFTVRKGRTPIRRAAR